MGKQSMSCCYADRRKDSQVFSDSEYIKRPEDDEGNLFTQQDDKSDQRSKQTTKSQTPTKRKELKYRYNGETDEQFFDDDDNQYQFTTKDQEVDVIEILRDIKKVDRGRI